MYAIALALCIGQVPQAPPVNVPPQAPPVVVYQPPPLVDPVPEQPANLPVYSSAGTIRVIDGQRYRANGAGWWIREEQARAAAPFDLSATAPVGAADDDSAAAGPWPEGIPFPEGFVSYKPARFTQSIATSNMGTSASALVLPTPKGGVGVIDRVDRRKTKPKYQQPGGLLNVRGWRSDLYKHLPAGVSDYVAWLPVKNSFGSFQNEMGLSRSFLDGDAFMDVLSNAKTGRVFEVRMRVKGRDRANAWSSFVDYRDPSERPTGYVALRTSECRSCHDDPREGPGTGGYNEGLVVGADGVFSLPFAQLEM